MHIPDGYLSPVSCVVSYALALPFWYVALNRVKGQLHTRMVPLLAVFSAFCFVIMLFNLPLPGGTSGHATGVAIASIVLGPWAAMVVLSVALLIQALFFGDGGITTLAANCLNMAVVGSLVAHASYRLVAGHTALSSMRRVVAAALAGYLAINAAALLAALEFGLQPLLFHDAAGAPLYAPYPLAIALPAMMLGHLGVAGLAELLLSAGLLSYLQRAHPELLALGAQGAASHSDSAWRSTTRRLWYGLAALLMLTPLGLLAGGTAWGEWHLQQFASAEGRTAIAQASGQTAAPAQAPVGMEQLAAWWQAPMPDYAPPFLQHTGLGYLLSAMFGVGLIVLLFLLLSGVRAKARRHG